MAATQRRLGPPGPSARASYDLQLVPLPVGVARQMLAGKRRPAPMEGHEAAAGRWHPEYPMLDSIDAIAMVFAAHRAMVGAVKESPAWWIHQIVVDGVVVGDIGFHGPPSPEREVEIGYTVVPAWRGRGVASRACALILQEAWRDGADTVVAETDDGNVSSQAVLLRNGFERRPDGVFVINCPEAR
jgi:[ribosomal protein S5]-alanine N-acetyltransferase